MSGEVPATATGYVMCVRILNLVETGSSGDVPATTASYMLSRKDCQYWRCNCHCRQLQSVFK